MSDIKLNNNGDIDVTDNKLVLLTDPLDCLKQRLTIRLKTFREEWFLNRNAGLPYFQTIFTKAASKSLVDSLFRGYILETNGVRRVTEFTSVKDDANRTYTLSFKATTEDGQVLTIKDFEV